jgi:hypothetical protein
MRGFPIDDEVSAENLVYVAQLLPGDPTNRLRQMTLWAQFQAGQIGRPLGAGRQDPPGRYAQLYSALDGHGIVNPESDVQGEPEASVAERQARYAEQHGDPVPEGGASEEEPAGASSEPAA